MNESSAPKPKKSVALSGVVAANTAICTVGRTGNDLHYRGYDILEIAEVCEFEEIAYLLIHERLPTRAALAAYKVKLRSLRGLPAPVRSVLEELPASSHPMDVLRTGVSALGCTLPEPDEHSAPGARDIADRLIASLGPMLAYWYHFSRDGQRIELETDDDSIGGHFLHLLHRRPPPPFWVRAMHTSHPLRRARARRLDLHGARHRRHGLGPLLVHHRGDRRAAGAQARRRERSRDADPAALPHAGGSGSGHPRARREPRDHRRLRAPGVHARRSAQSGDPGSGAAALEGSGRHADVRYSRADREGNERGEGAIPESRLVLGRGLSHDGRADRDVHAAVRDRPHYRLVGARHRA